MIGEYQKLQYKQHPPWLTGARKFYWYPSLQKYALVCGENTVKVLDPQKKHLDPKSWRYNLKLEHPENAGWLQCIEHLDGRGLFLTSTSDRTTRFYDTETWKITGAAGATLWAGPRSGLRG